MSEEKRQAPPPPPPSNLKPVKINEGFTRGAENGKNNNNSNKR